nr:transient receptor potential cation channel subfamily M member 2-like [Parasteatoda tepidariorum]
MQTSGAPQDPFESFNKISHNDDDIDNGFLHVGTKHIPFLLSSCTTFDTAKIFSKLLANNNWKTPRVVLFLDASTEEMLDTSEECRLLGHLLIKGLMSTLNTTETWLCTNGLDEGFTSELGEAFKNEISRRKVFFRQKNRYAFPEAALIGIHRLDALRISEKIEFMREDLEKQQGLKKDINENFDCYVFLKDAHKVKQGVSNFMLSFLSHISEGRISLNDDSREDISRKKIPVVVILFHGELNDMDMILGLIKKGLPLIVMKGSGGLADLISFTYSQIRNFHDSINLGEYCETVIKPLFLEQWDKLCPDGSLSKTLKQEIFMKIINCIRCSYQHGRETITVLNRFDLEDDSIPLNSYLLKASFNSRPDDFIFDSHNMREDLLLTMNWNNPDVAKSEILYKDNGFKIDNEIFFKCLVKPEREQFIAMFLKNGFKVRKFINSQVLSSLFQNSLKEMFFRSVVWETIFGYRSTVKIPGYAIEHKLSHLLEKFTSIPDLINCRQIYCGVGDELKEDQSERRAISVLTLWAVLSYRSDLVKILLNYSEQPIYLAVVCSAVFNRLKTFVVDLNMQEDISQQSKMLSETAIQLLSYCYDKVPCRALAVLCAKSSVWSYKPLIETAAFAKNRYFLAHPCCQKYLDCVLMGNINIVNLRYGDVTLPQWLKLILCTFFIFPMLLWIKFESTNLSESSYHTKFHDSVKRSVNGNFSDAEKNRSCAMASLWKSLFRLCHVYLDFNDVNRLSAPVYFLAVS